MFVTFYHLQQYYMPGASCVLCGWEHVRYSVGLSRYQHTQLIQGVTVMTTCNCSVCWGRVCGKGQYALTIKEHELSAPISHSPLQHTVQGSCCGSGGVPGSVPGHSVFHS
jgi:hypothetical protein